VATVSVVIPTYNRRDLLIRAIESVLAQSVAPAEIIIVDDGSTDGTEEALRPLGSRIIYVRTGNRGISAARNAGAGMATGEWIAYLDNDDAFMPQKIERYLASAEEVGSSARFVFSDFTRVLLDSGEALLKSQSRLYPVIYSLMRRRSEVTYTADSQHSLRLMLLGYRMYPSVFMVHRDVHRHLVWDEQPGIGEDLLFGLHASQLTGFCYVDEPTTVIGVHGGNVSNNREFMLRGHIAALEAFLSTVRDGTRREVDAAVGRALCRLGYYYRETGAFGKARATYRLALRRRGGRTAALRGSMLAMLGR